MVVESWHLGSDIAHNRARFANQLVPEQLLYNQQWPNGVGTVGEQHVLSCHCLDVSPPSIHSGVVDHDLHADTRALLHRQDMCSCRLLH